ncbi:MAG: hypothetical protein WAT79_09725 [Saprospiraceae bacterium]
MYIYNLLKTMEDSNLVSFLNNYGTPFWEYSIQKGSDDLKITSIPVVLNDSVNGVIKLFLTSDSVLRVNFFSKNELNEAIDEQNLNDEEFHMYKGAIQSFLLTEYLYCGHINSEFFNWLIVNKDRMESRVAWYCIEDWECTETIIPKIKRPVELYAVNLWYYQNQNLIQTQTHCILLSRECWIDWTPKNFPGNIGNGNTGNNNNNNNNNGPGSNSNNNNTYRNEKNNYLTDFLNYNGINSSYSDLLFECIGILRIPNSSEIEVVVKPGCIREKLNSEIINVLGLTEVELERLSDQELFTKLKIADCLRKTGDSQDAEKDKLIDFYQNTELINPCEGIDKDEIFLSLCEENKVNSAGLDGALTELDIIVVPVNFEMDCPCFDKILKNLKEGPEGSWLCDMVRRIDESTNYTQ